MEMEAGIETIITNILADGVVISDANSQEFLGPKESRRDFLKPRVEHYVNSLISTELETRNSERTSYISLMSNAPNTLILRLPFFVYQSDLVKDKKSILEYAR